MRKGLRKLELLMALSRSWALLSGAPGDGELLQAFWSPERVEAPETPKPDTC